VRPPRSRGGRTARTPERTRSSSIKGTARLKSKVRSKREGVAIGRVKNVDDPQGLGRIQISLPGPSGRPTLVWARVATLMAGKGRGSWFMPEPEDEVLIAFESGEPARPYGVGSLWNSRATPPRTDPRVRVLRSVRGHELELADTGAGYVRISDAHGNVIELSGGRIKITGLGVIEIKAPQVVINSRPVGPGGGPI
jgi:uncharacterized protein involved in type VI secretion and phage assembly